MNNYLNKHINTPRKNLSRVWAKFIGVCLLLIISAPACNEDDFLKEIPLDFLSPENSFVNINQFESALTTLYSNYRSFFWGQESANSAPRVMFSGTDLVMNDKDLGESPPDWSALLLPTTSRVENMWSRCYQIIYDANVIIGRASATSSELTTDQQNAVVAEAMFFRALCYRILANLYGGVPIILEETTSPRRDLPVHHVRLLISNVHLIWSLQPPTFRIWIRQQNTE